MARNINVSFVVGDEIRHAKVVMKEDKCHALISEWERFANADPSNFVLTTDSGHQLRGNETVGDLVPGRSRNLEVFVNRAGTSTREVETSKPKYFGPDTVCIASDPRPKRVITCSACGRTLGECRCRPLPPSYEESQGAQGAIAAVPVPPAAPRDSAHVQARPLQQLRFYVENPHGDWETVEVTVSAGATVGEAIATARPLLRRLHIGSDAVMITQWIRHGAAGAEGRALRCWDPEEKKFLWIDNKSGQEVPVSSSTFLIRRFLLPSSPLPTSPRLLPGIIIYTEAEWLQVSGERQLQHSPAAEQSDPSFVTQLWGVRTETGQHFWGLADNSYVNGATGEVRESDEDLPAGESRCFFCLLRPSDRIPRIAVPSGKYLAVLNRAGTAVRVERGQLKAEGPKGQPDLLEWEIPYRISEFHEDLTAAARK